MRFRVPKTEVLELIGERKIVYSDLDYNMHMNNTRYADMLCDFMPYDKIPNIRGISLSYLHEAAFGNTVKVYRSDDGEKFDFRTVNEEGKVCLEAEIIL
jgi:acyl-ACP thioesterase